MDLGNSSASANFSKVSSSNMQIPRLSAINLISKPDVNNSCFQENLELPRFYHQSTLYLDSNLPFHLMDQQNHSLTPEMTSFPSFSTELHRHFVNYHHSQFSNRIDTQIPSPNNGMQINLLPPPHVPVIAPEENSNGLRCLPNSNHSNLNSSVFPVPCQNNSYFNSNHFPMDSARLPHNVCNLGIINLQHRDRSEQLECNNSENANFTHLDSSEEHISITTKRIEVQEKFDSEKLADKPTQKENIDDDNDLQQEIKSQSEDSDESDEIVEIQQNRVIFCKVCRKGYGSKESLEAHMLSHGPHKCPMCNKIFSRQCNLKIHMAVHAERTCVCKDCGKSFKSENALHAHSTTVHINSDLNSVICESCGIVLKNRKSLLQHEQIHTRGKRFACDLCDERFNRKDALNRHVVRIHVEERFFTCQVCKTHFNTNDGLQEHLWTHEIERPHQCHLCQRRFPQRSALERHVKIHSGQRPFSCGVCGLSFTRSYRLKAHLQSHLGT